ncbi:MAG: hypothetical protein WC742_11905 [Gallionellaceae bacterium]|jgi:hypothetical protein
MMKKIFYTLGLTLLSQAALAAENATIEGIDKKVDTVIQMQERIYDKVENDPAKGKNFGVELNLVRLLLADKNFTEISGTVSYFNHQAKAEIAFPFFYSEDKGATGVETFKVSTLDVHYRQYLGETLNGFYLSGFARYAKLEGVTGENLYFITINNGPVKTEDKFGVGFGMGYRVFSKMGLYWGSSLSLGRYLVGNNDMFAYDSVFYDDNRVIMDIELLKFGYAF